MYNFICNLCLFLFFSPSFSPLCIMEHTAVGMLFGACCGTDRGKGKFQVSKESIVVCS